MDICKAINTYIPQRTKMKKLLLAIFIMVPILTAAKEDKGNIYTKQVQCFPTEILLNKIPSLHSKS